MPNSGRDVAVASNTTPIIDLPRPVLSAILSADLARKFEAYKIIAVVMPSCIHKDNIAFIILQERIL